MSVQPSNTKDSKTLPLSWQSLSDWWAPAMTGCATANDRAHRACKDMAVEWQAFVGRRFDEDVHLLQELSAAKAPDEVWSAWSRFWQKAAEDYGAEYSAIAKLAADFVPHGIGAGAAGSNGSTRATQSKAA
jgi:hypothetical protein